MPSALERDLERLAPLAFHRREWAEDDVRRYHALLRKKGRKMLGVLDGLYAWIFVPTTLWPLNVQDVFHTCLECIEGDHELDEDMRFLLKTLPEAPPDHVCQIAADHEHSVRLGRYESLVQKMEKYESIEAEARRNPGLISEWEGLKSHWDVSKFADHKGIIRRSITGERNMRESFRVDWRNEAQRFQAVFDAFCLRWTLYGMQGDTPLTMKLSVNLTPHGTMIFIPAYWSLDGKRDLNWPEIMKLHRARALKKQGEALAKGLEERQRNAARLHRLDAEAKRRGFRGEKKHAFLCEGLGWVAETSAKRLSMLRREFPAGSPTAKRAGK